MKRRYLDAFTLVELLVVIAIIGILVSLLLPAIQASRESARRAMCTNQVRQLILAVQDYEMAHEHYPSGTVNAQGPIQNLPNGQHISWIARILPYIEENALYDSLDLSLSAYNHENDKARQTRIEILFCPSCPADQWPYSNYAGCHHDVEAPIDINNHGVLFLNSQITREDLKDGAAYTLFLGEKEVDNFDLGWLSGTPSTLRNTGTQLHRVKGSWGSTSSSPSWVHSYLPDDSQWQWNNEQIDPVTGEFVTVETPVGDEPPANADAATVPGSEENAPATAEQVADAPAGEVVASNTKVEDPALKPDANGMLPHSRLGGNVANPLYVGGFASSHFGGVNFALGDGSVRFISDNVSAGLLGRLANRDDGQIVNANEW